MSTDIEKMEVPSLTNLIRAHQESHDAQFRVALPGVITEYDSIRHLAKVQPLLKTSGRNGRESEDLPVIVRVPILFPRTAKAAMYLPISKGDFVTLIFSDRHLEAWKASTGKTIEADTDRQHNLTDCWAFPGGWPETQLPAQVNKDAFEVLVESGTKIALGNGADELLQIASNAFTSLKDLVAELSQTLADIKLITTTVPPGMSPPAPFPIDNISSFISIESAVSAIESDIDAEISSLGRIKT